MNSPVFPFAVGHHVASGLLYAPSHAGNSLVILSYIQRLANEQYYVLCW